MSALDHWRGDTRTDGVSVYSWVSELSGRTLWGVKSAHGYCTTLCPCCHRPLWDHLAAKMLANHLYPLREQPT